MPDLRAQHEENPGVRNVGVKAGETSFDAAKPAERLLLLHYRLPRRFTAASPVATHNRRCKLKFALTQHPTAGPEDDAFEAS